MRVENAAGELAFCHALAEPEAACVSGIWDEDSYYSEAVTWALVGRSTLKALMRSPTLSVPVAV